MPAPALLPGPAPARRAPPGECLFMCDIGPKVLGPVFKPKGFKVTSSTAPGLIIYIASYFDRCVPPVASRLPIASSGCGRVAVWLRSGCGLAAVGLRLCGPASAAMPEAVGLLRGSMRCFLPAAAPSS